MRIAHLGPTSPPVGHNFGGAVQRRMRELAGAQQAAGDEVVLFSATSGDSSSVHEASLDVRDVPCRMARPTRDLEFLMRLRPTLRSWRPDIVHVHNNWAGATFLRGIPAPKVLSFDYFRYRWSENAGIHRMYRAAIRAFDGLLPVSDYCRDEAATWWRMAPSDFEVLPNGVNLDVFRPDDARREHARAVRDLTDRFVIGYVGRINLQKGSDVLLDAFAALRVTHPAAALVMAGPAGQFGTTTGNDLTQRLERLGGTWLGAVAEEALPDVFRSCDVFVMPTRWNEMFGMAAVEALASGVPVVASRLGGLNEVVSSAAGSNVPPGEAEPLAAALRSLADSPDALQSLRAAARESVTRFAWEEVAKQAAAIYAGVLTGSRGQGNDD